MSIMKLIVASIGRVIQLAGSGMFAAARFLANRLTGFRQSTAAWFQTFSLYLVASLPALLLGVLPLPLVARVGGVTLVAMLLSWLTVTRMRFGCTERDIKEHQRAICALEQCLAEKEQAATAAQEEARNREYSLLNMSWLLELNLAWMETRHTRTFDSYLPNSGKPEPWNTASQHMPAAAREGDRRAIGVLQLDYDTKAGIDLHKVQVMMDGAGQTALYWLPDVHTTGFSNPDAKWVVRLVHAYKRGPAIGRARAAWHVVDEDSNTLPLWEEQLRSSYSEALVDRKLDADLQQRIAREAHTRVRSILEGLLPGWRIEATENIREYAGSSTLLLPTLMDRQLADLAQGKVQRTQRFPLEVAQQHRHPQEVFAKGRMSPSRLRMSANPEKSTDGRFMRSEGHE